MDFDSSQPIWLQLHAEFSRRIAAGQWSLGARIAGVRELALDLKVNPNTVQRALGELERDGLVHSERTAGRFVTQDQSKMNDLKRRLAADAADDFVRRVQGFGMALTQAHELVEERWTHDDTANNTDAAKGTQLDV